MGTLAKNSVESSAFRYVEFIGKTYFAYPPQTGDTSRPLLWLGIGMVALALAGGVYTLLILLRRRK